MLFNYEAADKKGIIVRGEIDVPDKARVVSYLERNKLTPIWIAEKGAITQRSTLSKTFYERITPLDKILIVRNLSATIQAGLNLLEGLEILIADTTKSVVRNVLVQAKSNLENGQQLSVTFKQYSNIFPPVFVGLLRAGEASGNLGKALDELASHLSREYELGRRVRSALAYPTILLIGSIGVIVLLLVFILPRLAKTFSQTGTELPFITKVLVAVSGFVVSNWIINLILLVGIVLFFIYYRKTDRGRRILMKIILSIPGAKEVAKKISLVRITRTIGSLAASGNPILESLDLAGESSGNAVYKKALHEIREQVKKGVPLAVALENYPELFPHFLTSLVAVGERTGTIEHVMKTSANFYDEEVDHTLKEVTTFIEPALLLFLGLVIGIIAVSILQPIYQLVGQFS